MISQAYLDKIVQKMNDASNLDEREIILKGVWDSVNVSDLSPTRRIKLLANLDKRLGSQEINSDYSADLGERQENHEDQENHETNSNSITALGEKRENQENQAAHSTAENYKEYLDALTQSQNKNTSIPPNKAK